MNGIKKVFIAGAAGMVGRNICDALGDSEYELLTPGHRELDLMDQNAVNDWLAARKPDLVINCAGRVGGIAANMSDQAGFLTDNLRINLNLIMGSKEAGIKKLLNMASSCMYPANSSTALTEDKVLTGALEATNEGYAIAKCAAVKLCQFISAQYPEFQYKSLIPCNLYGLYDKFDGARAHLIPAIILKIDEAIRDNRQEVEIWGTGQARREFMFAGDLAQLVVMALRKFDELPAVMNTGIGKDYTVNEYYELVAKVMGYSGQFAHNKSRPEGMRKKLVDISRQTAFGFTPKTSLENGVRQTWEWYRARRK